MKCVNCDNEAVGRSKYCSDKCKVAWNRNKRNTESVTDVTEKPIVTTQPNAVSVPVLPANFGLPNCGCKHCQQNRANGSKHIINHGLVKMYDQLASNELNRVSLPGDVDYDGICNDKRFDSRRISRTVSEVAV